MMLRRTLLAVVVGCCAAAMKAEGAKDSTLKARPKVKPLRPGASHCRSMRAAASVRTHGVVVTEDDKGRGAGLRISGATEKRPNGLAGESKLTPLAYEFTVDEAREVILVAELRASKGDAWFPLPTMRLRKL